MSQRDSRSFSGRQDVLRNAGFSQTRDGSWVCCKVVFRPVGGGWRLSVGDFVYQNPDPDEVLDVVELMYDSPNARARVS